MCKDVKQKGKRQLCTKSTVHAGLRNVPPPPDLANLGGGSPFFKNWDLGWFSRPGPKKKVVLQGFLDFFNFWFRGPRTVLGEISRLKDPA